MVIDEPVSTNIFAGCSLTNPSTILEGPHNNISCVLQIDSLLDGAVEVGTQLISSFLLSTSTFLTIELILGGFSNTAS